MFQSAPPVKGAMVFAEDVGFFGEFQSAPPVKGAIASAVREASLRQFQSAPPVKGAMQVEEFQFRPLGVSIRAPREGGDSPE